MSILSAWEQAQPALREKVGETSFRTWFSSIVVREGDSQTLIVETPDEFFKNWIVEHYAALIQSLLEGSHSAPVAVEYHVNRGILKEDTKTRFDQLEQKFQDGPTHPKNINSRFTFENFVVGPSNRFASAACMAVADSPAKAYNPLFIYGPVGLGKTHLIQSITHRIRQNHPRLKHCYLSSEQFTNELIDAIRHRSTNAFRKKYREIDVLLIDDIHFIAGKESTQEEFFHTFNYLHDNRKQIIITSDRPPKEISNLEERLRSRFAWGLITDIQPPDFETRVAILRKKVENESVNVPDDVISFIASEVTSNIRELEGALIRVAAYALMEDSPVTLENAKLILRDMVKESAKNISIDTIQKTVSKYFQIPLSELRAKRRNKNIVQARQVAMYLSRQLSKSSLPEIGNAFGGKDHTTVLHSCRKIEKELEDGGELKMVLMKLTTALKQ